MKEEFLKKEHINFFNDKRRNSGKLIDYQSAKRLLLYFKDEYKLLFIIFILLLISVFCSILTPFLLGKAIDECVAIANNINLSGSFHQLLILIIQFITLNLISSLALAFSEYSMTLASQNAARKLSEESFNKLNKLKIKYFDTTLRGNILSYFSSDIERIKESLGATFIQLISGILTLLGAIIVMLHISPGLTIITATTTPLVFLLSRFITRKSRKYFRQYQSAVSSLNGMVEESLNGLSVIQSFNNEENINLQFQSLNESVRKIGIKSQIYSGILMPLMRVLDSFGYILTTIFGAIFAVKGYITIGNIQSFILYVKNFQRPLFTLIYQLNTLQAALVSAERIFNLLDEDMEEELDREIIMDKSKVKGKIEFNNLHFSYKPNKTVLNGVSCKIEPGEVVAIVGTTGAGKTTLFNLLSGMYDYEVGSIKIDGFEVKELNPRSLRTILGCVLQEPIVFTETLRFNIAYGKPKATNEEIQEIIDLTHSRHLIDRLPNGFNQHLREINGQISQGQRQLLTIARAFLPNAPILLLDEATSNLDSRSEGLLQEALKSLTKNRTCLIIAHRLTTIKNADKILVLDNGKIAEIGTHKELVEKKGIYYEIYTSQFRSS